jgi:hypothetical protein
VAAGPIVSIFSGLIALFIFQTINPGIVYFELMFFGSQDDRPFDIANIYVKKTV